MADMEKLQTYKVICEGGLDSNQNYLQLADRTPGAATYLLNFEPSLFGGYRRLDGFEPLEENYAEVDSAGSEGKILGVTIFEEDIVVARKTKSVSTYQFFYWTSGGDWTALTTGLTHTVTGINKLRFTNYNFDGTNHLAIVDGVNKLLIYDGTAWGFVSSSGTGANLANAGGDQALTNPKYITNFKNHVFVSGDSTSPHIVAHSAPNDDVNWTVAAGSGQLNVGFTVVQIKPFRDELFVFGETKIKKIVVEGTDFVVKDVTANVGCLASDSVIEVNGDLLFLAQDGIRTIAATERLNDVELGVQSKPIQQDVTNLIAGADLGALNALVIRRKSQVRFFFSDELLATASNEGILGGLRATGNGFMWEWGLTRGIRTSCATSGYIGTQEYVLHGDYNGKVYRQEVGSSFDGANITAAYTTPYFDMGDIHVRKTIHKVTLFLKPEDEITLSMAQQFNWNERNVLNPTTYLLEQEVSGTTYGTGIYNQSRYASTPVPIKLKNVEGSGFSTRLTFSSSDTNGSYSIQAIVFEFSPNGRK